MYWVNAPPREPDRELSRSCDHCEAARGEPCTIPNGDLYRDWHPGREQSASFWATRYHRVRGGRLVVFPRDREAG